MQKLPFVHDVPTCFVVVLTMVLISCVHWQRRLQAFDLHPIYKFQREGEVKSPKEELVVYIPLSSLYLMCMTCLL